MPLTHIDDQGHARMVDVSEKDTTVRTACARATVRMKPQTHAMLRDGSAPKGDVLAVARVAGIMAAKKTPDLIPLCHHIALTGVELTLELDVDGEHVRIESTVRCLDRTGVEMEALSAVTVAALTVYDMLKAVDRGMRIDEVHLVSKTGGRSGDYVTAG